MKSTIVLIVFLIVLTGCKDNFSGNSNTEIPLGEQLGQLSELKTSDYFSNIRYIPLETTEECLIGNMPQISLLRDKIVVSTSQGQCMLFDAQTGKFIRNIGHRGSEPGGYSSVRCWIDEMAGLLYFSGWDNDLIVYNEMGEFVNQIKVPASDDEKYPNFYYHLPGDTLVGYYENWIGDQNNKLLYFTKDSERIAVAPLEEKVPLLEIVSISVLKDAVGQEIYGQAGIAGVILIESKNPDMRSTVLMGSNHFWQVNDNIYFKQNYNDTIYRMDGLQLKPHITFALGDYHWPYEERYNQNMDKNIIISYILESEKTMFFQFITNIFKGATSYMGAFDRATGELKINKLEKQIKDDITNFVPVLPETVSSSGTFAGLIPVEEVLEWFDKNPGKEVPSSLQFLKKLKEDDNPIVVLMK